MSSPENISPQNTLDIIKPFVDLTGNDADIQIMGGIGTAALEHPDTFINSERREIHAPKGFYQSSYRDNGTLRDVDVFVISSDMERIAEVEADLHVSVGSELERAVFGIHPHSDLGQQLARPFGKQVLKMFTSDRYEVSPDIPGVYVKSLFPFVVPIEPATLETWTLVTDMGIFPIPHPGTTIANYTNRSISGVRHKDLPKMTQATRNVFFKAPEIREWLIDGPGQSQLELGTLIASLHSPGVRQLPLLDGLKVDTFTPRQLHDHERFVLPDLSNIEKIAIIALASFKSKHLKQLEENDALVKLWQRYGEPRATSIVKNV